MARLSSLCRIRVAGKISTFKDGISRGSTARVPITVTIALRNPMLLFSWLMYWTKLIGSLHIKQK